METEFKFKNIWHPPVQFVKTYWLEIIMNSEAFVFSQKSIFKIDLHFSLLNTCFLTRPTFLRMNPAISFSAKTQAAAVAFLAYVVGLMND